jgi:hypothetical protein
MTSTRRRFKQTTTLQERLQAFAQDLSEQASVLPEGEQRDALLKRARQADVAAHIDEWAQSAGLQPPT